MPPSSHADLERQRIIFAACDFSARIFVIYNALLSNITGKLQSFINFELGVIKEHALIMGFDEVKVLYI